MHVGAPGEQAKPALHERRREGLRVGDDLPLVGLELRAERLFERHRLGGDDVHQRPALVAGKDRRIEALRVALGREDQPAARTAQRFVRRAGDEVA